MDEQYLDDPDAAYTRYVRVFTKEEDGCGVDSPARSYRVGFKASDMQEGAVVAGANGCRTLRIMLRVDADQIK